VVDVLSFSLLILFDLSRGEVVKLSSCFGTVGESCLGKSYGYKDGS
jgi:hypothetical protein